MSSANGPIAALSAEEPATDTSKVERVIHRSTRTMAESEDKVRDTLRDDILASVHDDFVSMADVRTYVFGGLLASQIADLPAALSTA